MIGQCFVSNINAAAMLINLSVPLFLLFFLVESARKSYISSIDCRHGHSNINVCGWLTVIQQLIEVWWTVDETFYVIK